MGADSAIVPSVVYIGADGSRLYGTAAANLAGAEQGRVLRGFVRRIGDETPMVPEAGASTAAHRLTADFVAWVVAQASAQEGRAPEAVAVTYPVTWGPHKRKLLASALLEAGVAGATLVPAPVAVAATGAPGRAHADGAVVAVYDLGGRTFNAALVRRERSGAWTSIGRPADLPDFGGADLDDLVFAHVVGGLAPDQQQAMAQLDANDEATAAGLVRLRAACVKAKESLSAEPVTTVEVKLPGITSKVRLTRGEFETMISAALETTVDVLDSVLDSTGLVAADVDCILLTGGSSRIPLVTQLLSRQFQVPVLAAGGANDASAGASGAVLALGHAATEPTPPAAEPTLPAASPAARAAVKTPKIAAKAVRGVAGKAPTVPAPAKPVAPTPVTPVASAAVAAAPAPELPLPAPMGSTSKPIRQRRPSRRAEIVGLEGLAPVARFVETPVLDGPRAVIAPRAVRSVDALLVEERTLTPRIADQVPPPRPALDDTAFEHIEDVEIEQQRTRRTRRPLVSIRRSLALTVLTSAIYVGSTAWIPATPAITDGPIGPTLQVPAATHAPQQ
ncbi:MAG TPA: Hsp70 family protein [Sporichthya sp.]|nr:Hsp70 family protein [Sporichthya sp.]